MSYREEVLRTSPALRNKDRFLLGALGLAGESGETVDLLKKYFFHGAQLNQLALKNELGDVRWYMEQLCIAAGFTMEEVEQANVEKLRLRYPNGFVEGGGVR